MFSYVLTQWYGGAGTVGDGAVVGLRTHVVSVDVDAYKAEIRGNLVN